MSLRGYQPKTKPALWASMDGGIKPRAKTLDEMTGTPGGFEKFLARERRRTAKEQAKWRERIQQARQPRPAIATASRARRSELVAYRKERREFLRSAPYCEVCVAIATLDRSFKRREHESEDVHHVRGRIGRLLRDRRWWKAVCREAHDWIHGNPNLARALELLAEPGQWNKYEA